MQERNRGVSSTEVPETSSPHETASGGPSGPRDTLWLWVMEVPQHPGKGVRKLTEAEAMLTCSASHTAMFVYADKFHIT